jgi:hypothetical protein
MGCSLCDIKSKIENLKNILQDNVSDINQKIKDFLSPAEEALQAAEDNMNKIKNKILEIMNTKSDVASKSTSNTEKHSANKQESDGHDMQDAEEDIKWDPLEHLKVYYTNIEYMNPASYSNSQDYPTKRGWIDEQKNFETWNLTTGEWWRVHHTGYYQKVDGNGSYEEKIPGTAFYYTFGDVQNSIEGNVDRVIKQNYYTYTMMEKTEDIDGDHFLNNNSNWFINTLLTHNEFVGVMKNVVVGGPYNLTSGANITIKAAGNITIKAGGVITIKGAKINLN